MPGGRGEFNIEVVPTTPEDTGMQTFHVEIHVPFHSYVHPKVVSGQSTATLGLQSDHRRLA